MSSSKINEADLISTHVKDSLQAIDCVEALKNEIIKIVDICETTSRAGGTIYAFGNGGSACEAIHLVEELVARYLMERPGIKAQHFLDTAVVTCWGNDYDYQQAFSRQAETHVEAKDVVFAFSTSGNSLNVLNGIEAANKKGAKTILIGGKDGGKAKDLVTIPLIVNAPRTMRIQEAHLLIVHLICHLLENRLFPEKAVA
jgi:D-sedoheptulose 7-phosphate isomerase